MVVDTNVVAYCFFPGQYSDDAIELVALVAYLGACPRIGAVARESHFEPDFSIKCGEYWAYLTNLIGKSGQKGFSAVGSLFSDRLLEAPSIWQSEFRNVLALYLRKKLVSLKEAVEIHLLADERLTTVQSNASTQPVLELVNASSCSAYDCEFVALAQQLDTRLVTQDKKILREFPDTAITIGDALKLV